MKYFSLGPVEMFPLKMEKLLWEKNNSTAISFIGGSCKLCKNGCGSDKCNNPYMARSPLEATDNVQIDNFYEKVFKALNVYLYIFYNLVVYYFARYLISKT